MIRIGRQELRQQITVPAVEFDAIEARFFDESNGFDEIFDELIDLGDGHRSDKSRAIDVKAPRSPERRLTAGATMGHIAAVPDLDRGFCPGFMDGVGQFFEFVNDFFAHPELTFE